MPAVLDFGFVRRLTDAFPGVGWETISTRIFVADRNGEIYSDWRSKKELEYVGGVYAILLPTAWFVVPRILHLHAPQGASPIPFEFTVPDLTTDGYGVVYVGRTTKLCQRWRGHLTRGERKDGGQVKFGLADCLLHPDETSALRALREHGRIVYTILAGPEQCANRDLLEMSLCARFAPAFNIKSER
jgi:hypothetical protein